MLREKGILHMTIGQVKSLVAELSATALSNGIAEMAAIVPTSRGQREAIWLANLILSSELERR